MKDGFEGIQDHSRKVQELAVAQFYREWLVKRGIPLELAEIAHLRVDVANNLNRQLDADTKEGKKHPWLAPNEYGVYIPFLDLNGDPIPGVYAIRRSGTEMPKYLTPGGSRGVYAYLAPIYNWNEIARDTHYNIVIVEGPPKALTMMQYLPTDTVVIAIPGVTMWDVASNMGQVPRGLEKFVWAGRKVAVLFDRDTKESAVVNVSRARSRIVDVLLKLHADAYVIDLPDDGSPKTGPDDWLVAGGKWEDLVWQAQDIQSHPIRMLRAQSIVCSNPSAVVDLITGQVWDYHKWKTFHLNKFVLQPSPDDPRKTKKVMAAEVIWNDPDREEVAGIDFQPGREPMSVFKRDGDRVLNVWRGFRQGGQGNKEAWDKFLQFVGHVVPNEQEATWLLRYMAHGFQRPEERPQHMAVLVSVMTGTGKSTIARVWTEAMGRYGKKVKPSEFFSGFNMFLYQNLALWVDELKDGEHKQSQIVEILKDLVTTPTVMANEKHAPAFQVSIFSRILATTNDLSALKVGPTERRLNMIQCIEQNVDCFPEMKALAVWLNTSMTEEDRQGIVDGFMNLDLGDYAPSMRSLETEATEQAKEFSRWGIEEASDKVLEALISKTEAEGYDGVWVSNDWLPGLYLNEAGYAQDKWDNLSKALVTRARERGWVGSSEVVKMGGKPMRGQWVSSKNVAFKATERRLRLDGQGKKYV